MLHAKSDACSCWRHRGEPCRGGGQRAETPTEVDFAACNTDAQAAMTAGTATPTTKDYVRVESARTDSAATWTTWVGPISMESSDPQLIGMATDGITDAAYQATYRTCMRRNGF